MQKLYKATPNDDWEYQRDETDEEHHFWYDLYHDKEQRRDMRCSDIMGGSSSFRGNYAVLNNGELHQYTYCELVKRPRKTLEKWEKTGRQAEYLGIGKRASRYVDVEKTHWGMVDLMLEKIEKHAIRTSPPTASERKLKTEDLRHLGNFPLLDNYRDRFRTEDEWREAMAEQKIFLFDKIIGKPRESFHCTAEAYTRLGFVGIYITDSSYNAIRTELIAIKRKMKRKYINCRPVDDEEINGRKYEE